MSLFLYAFTESAIYWSTKPRRESSILEASTFAEVKPSAYPCVSESIVDDEDELELLADVAARLVFEDCDDGQEFDCLETVPVWYLSGSVVLPISLDTASIVLLVTLSLKPHAL